MDIKLYWKSLKNEIDAETWKSGKIYITEDKAEERAEAQVGNDTLDINYCYRKIEQGIMQLQDIAHKYFISFNRYYSSGNISDIVAGSVLTLKNVSTSVEVTFTVDHIVSGAYYDESGNGYTISETTYTFVSCYNTETSTDADDKLKNTVVFWGITLKFGDRQNVDSKLLASELHKYVILNVLQEWSKIAVPTLTAEYVNRQTAEETRIKSIIYRKEEPNWNE